MSGAVFTYGDHVIAQPELPPVGADVILQFRKYDGSTHWRHETVYLGEDEWGWWVGQDAGWSSRRPGVVHHPQTRVISLVTKGGTEVFTFHMPPHDTAIYIDIAWDVQWVSPNEIRGIDMDLDVVERTDERGIYIDDEDEWEEHAVLYAYPREIMALLPQRAAELESVVREHQAPCDEATRTRWFGVLDGVLAERD